MGQQNILNGLDSALGGMSDFFINVIGRYLCPLAALACVAALLFTVLRAGISSSNMKEQIESHLMKVAILIVCIILTLGFTVWANIMVG